MFKPKGKPEVEALNSTLPTILISDQAMTKMFHYTDIAKEEIGWLGTAVKDEDGIYVDDVFLPEQETSSVTADMLDEGLEKLAAKILSQENGMEVWNNIRVHGHSHVKMGTSPSSTDSEQLEKFSQIGHEWFLRIITNKDGDMRVDLFDYTIGVIYSKLPFIQIVSTEEKEISDKIEELENKLEEIIASRKENHKNNCEKEIKENVKAKKTYNNYNYGLGWGYSNTKQYNTNTNTYKHPYSYDTYEGYENVKDMNGYFKQQDDIEEIIDLEIDYGLDEIVEIAECSSIEEMEKILKKIKCKKYASGKLTEDDLWTMLGEALEVVEKYYGYGYGY